MTSAPNLFSELLASPAPIAAKPTKVSARHSKATQRWGSPEDIVERARRVMGGIDLDPCSESTFQAVVQAATYYSFTERGEDGLALPWFGRVFCNPPGGLVPEFWDRAITSSVDQFFWVGFSVEQLCILTDAAQHPLEFAHCILRKRIPFTRHDGFEGSPSHGNYVCYSGPNTGAFKREFAPLGRIG